MLMCFSPPVMLVTIAIELVLLIYSLWRYKITPLTRVVISILFLLALFQFSEYNVCGGVGIKAAVWSRIGFASITLLPPLGIHIIQILSNKKWHIISWFAYATAVVWEAVFLLGDRAFSGHLCAGNYVIFQLNHDYGSLYFIYYYFWLFAGIGLSLFLAYRATKEHIRKALLLQTVGYLVFLLPTTIANTVSPSTISGIPSVMCGFAVLYAFILVAGIMPIYSMGDKRNLK